MKTSVSFLHLLKRPS